MPASSARRGPSGTSAGIAARISSYSARLRRWASIWSGATAAGSAPKKILSTAWLRSSGISPVGSARHAASASSPFAVIVYSLRRRPPRSRSSVR